MAIDWTQIVKKYHGKWVALKSDRETVVGSGKTLPEALKQAKDKGEIAPIVTKIPAEIVPYIS